MSSKRSPKGMPEPYQLSDGTWEVRLRYTLIPHGKQYSIRFRDKKKSEVIKQLKAFDPHKDHVKRVKADVTVSEYAWGWMRTFKYPNIQPTSYDKIESTFVHHIEPAVGMIRLKNLTSKDIQTIINNMKAHPYSYSTVKKVYDFFNMLLRHAEKENDIDRNPMVSVVMPERKLFQKKEIRFFDEKELEKINAEAMREECGVRVNPENELFIVMENTGIRRDEVVGMMKTHIDWKNCRLHIRCNIQTCKKRDEMGNAIKKPIALALIFVFLLVGCAKDSGTTQPKEPQTPKTESKYYTNPDYAEGTVFEYDTFTSEVRWIENEGQQLFALLSLPKSYSGNEKLPVLILCHGFNGTLAEYDNYLSHFTGAGFACLSFDYRGGAYRNSKSDGNILYMTLDTEISDTIAVTGYAKSLPCVDAENMVIVGHSQGGVIAGLSAVTEELKDSFKGMLLLAPAFEMIKSIGSEYIDGTVDIPETKICLGVKVSGDYIRSVVTHYDVYDEISAFQYPVKIFLGTKDGLFTEADMQRAIAAYGDDVSSYVIVQDGMHDFSSSIVSELFPKEIEPFLKGLVE